MKVIIQMLGALIIQPFSPTEVLSNKINLVVENSKVHLEYVDNQRKQTFKDYC